MLMDIMISCSHKSSFVIEHDGHNKDIIYIVNPTKYLLQHVQNTNAEAQVMVDTDNPEDTFMDVRLATDSIDYYVPLTLLQGVKRLKVEGVN